MNNASEKEYVVLIGCNTSDGKRHEPGEDLGAVPAGDIAPLLEMNAIAEKENGGS